MCGMNSDGVNYYNIHACVGEGPEEGLVGGLGGERARRSPSFLAGDAG